MQDLLMMSVSINPKFGASRDRETKGTKRGQQEYMVLKPSCTLDSSQL